MGHDFDSALPALLWTLEQSPANAVFERICVVRDLVGRLRMVVQPGEREPPPDLGALEKALVAELGGWFAGPVLSTRSERPDEKRLATGLLGQAKPWPANWPDEGRGPVGQRAPIDPQRWRSIQRVHSKVSWLAANPGTPPWPLEEGKPAIVSFFSFKGGVGRSTALGVVAWQLAEHKKVVCIDLDLEAPGLASLFGLRPGAGVLDYLLTVSATDEMPADLPTQEVEVHGRRLTVVPAGAPAPGYVEKLARLDYLGGRADQGESPVERALRSLLMKLRAQVKPDVVLLDVRAGLHDLGGLSLNDLPHIDVVVGRAGRPALEGLGLALDALVRRRPPEHRRLVVAQTFTPLPLDGEISRAFQQRHREAVHQLFLERLYTGDDAPAEDDSTAAHYPWVVGRYDELADVDSLGNVSVSVLANDAYTALRRRIEELAEPEQTS